MKLVCWSLLLFSPFSLALDKTYGDVSVTQVSTIYDGDTFYVSIPQWPAIIGEHIAVRVKGVDAPEMKGKCRKEIELARKAKQFTVNFLRDAETIELRNLSRDKYFRIDADVYVGGKNLADELINHGLGYEYQGEAKKNWCASAATGRYGITRVEWKQ